LSGVFVRFFVRRFVAKDLRARRALAGRHAGGRHAGHAAHQKKYLTGLPEGQTGLTT
jgi:hypothetical protein